MTKSEISKKLYSLGLGGMKLQSILNSIDYWVHTKNQFNNIGKYEYIKNITIEYNEYFKADVVWVHYEIQPSKMISKLNVFVL